MINAIVAIGQVDWEAQFVSGLGHPMTGIQISRRCVDAVDVLAVSKVLSCDVVIISDHTMRLDEEFIATLTKQKIRVVALTSRPKFFENLGRVDCVVIDPNNPLSSIPVLSALLRVNKKQAATEPNPTGEMIFVGGFGGGTGKTRLALELARQLSSKDKKTLLVDADTYGPSMLQLLNQSTNSQGILEVSRKIERKNVTQNFISQNAISLNSNLAFIPGLVKTSRWVDLRPATLKEFWQLALAEFDYVIVDAGPVLEPEPAVALEIGMPKRNLVSVSALTYSHKVILTSRSDAVSVTRLIKGFTENATSFVNKSLSCVVMGYGSKRDAKDIAYAIRSNTEISNVQVLEFADKLIAESEVQNNFVSELEPNSALATSYTEIAQELIDRGNSPVANSRLQRLIPKKKSASVA